MPSVSLATERRYQRMVWPRLAPAEREWLDVLGAFRCSTCGYPGAVHAIGDGFYLVWHPRRTYGWQGATLPIPCRVPGDDPNIERAMSALADAHNGNAGQVLVDGMRNR